MKPNLNEIDLYFITDSKLTKNPWGFFVPCSLRSRVTKNPQGFFVPCSLRSRVTKKTILDDVKSAIKAGIKIIQYREKEKPTRLMYKEAKEIKKLCNKNNVLFIINDRIDICQAVDADGVHLGNDDMPYNTARKLLGNKIIGLTVHNVKEAIEAEKLGADYIGVSPIFETKTKLDAGPAAGLKLIKDVKKAVKIPFVAIGGINLENIDEVIKAGAKSAAVISAIVTKDDVEAECKKFINKLKKLQ